MKYEQKETEIKNRDWPNFIKGLFIIYFVLSSFWIIAGIIDSPTCIISKQIPQKALPKIKLEKYQMFYFDYAGLEIGTAKDFNKNGVFFTLPGEWLASSTQFVSYDDLLKDKTFKPLGIDPQFLPKNKIDNPLTHMKQYDMFKMNYGVTVSTFIVKGINTKGLLLTTTQWLWESEVFMPYSGYDSTFFLKLKKVYPHK